MIKNNSLKKVKRLSLLVIAVSATSVLISFGLTQKVHSKANLEMMSDGDDDEPLSSSCGGAERWSEKVFTDADAGSIDFAHPHNTGVTHLVGLPTVTPSTYQARIQPQEDSVYTVVVHITEYRVESDSDAHLVITDGTNTMIAEVPDPGCSSVAASPKVANFIVARDWVYKNLGYVTNTSVSLPLVQITGVCYYDPPHGQSGAAPNNMELHSVINIQFYTPTGIDQVVDNSSVSVFPNPSNGEFNVNIIPAKASMMIYNMLGEEVYTGELAGGANHVNITGKPAGIYIYKIINEDGGSVASGRLLIK